MKSYIDWNEVVPLLTDAQRSDLTAAAIGMLSGIHKAPRRGTVNRRNTDRYWRDAPESTSGLLAEPGRQYRINKDSTHNIRETSAIGKLWKLLVGSKNDHITYEGMASLAKGQKLSTSAVIGYLWSKGFIDVIVSEKKVAYAE